MNKINFIDTHTHLYLSSFDEDREKVIERAIKAGVDQFYQPAISKDYFRAMECIESSYPENIKLMIGLHPCEVKPETYLSELNFIKAQLDQRSFAAVGEIGIDLHWDTTTLSIQQEVFHTQIGWAKENHLPINVHCRDAFEETLTILEELKDQNLRGIFHCFSGTKAHAERAIACGMKLGIGGIITFKNGKIDQFLHEIDCKHLVLETDAPYLAPDPFRGKRNESAYLIKIAEKLAKIYRKSLKEIAEITTQNALNIYK